VESSRDGLQTHFVGKFRVLVKAKKKVLRKVIVQEIDEPDRKWDIRINKKDRGRLLAFKPVVNPKGDTILLLIQDQKPKHDCSHIFQKIFGMTLDLATNKNCGYFYLDEISQVPISYLEFLDDETILFQNSDNVYLTGLKCPFENDENEKIYPQTKPLKEIIRNVQDDCATVFAIDRDKNHVYYISSQDKRKIGRCELTKNQTYYFADDLPNVVSKPSKLFKYELPESMNEKVLTSAAVCQASHKVYILFANSDFAFL
jgi:hypothetical protein